MRTRPRQRKAGRGRAAPGGATAPVVTLTPASVTASLSGFPQVFSLVATWRPAGTSTVTIDWGYGLGPSPFAGQASGVDVVALSPPTYPAEGPYTATVTVTPDPAGPTGSKTAGVTVGP